MPLTSDPEARKRSLANLNHFQPGQSGNPRGRPAAGAVYVEWLNGMAGKTEKEIQTIADDKTLSAHQRMAARTTLRGLSNEYHGHIPLAANDLDRMSDRTVGKPPQTMLIHHSRPDDADALTEQIRQMLARDPELCRVLGEQAPKA